MTDHIKDQLCQLIEELEAEKMELNEQLDVAQQERAALAAHLDRIKSILGEGVDVVERSGELAWSVCPDEVSEWENSEPAVSLARLKAEWLKGIKQQSRRVRNYSAPDQVFVAIPLNAIDCELRQQAEGGEA